MRHALLLLVVMLFVVAGCKKDESGTNGGPGNIPGGRYFPFEVGRSWTFNTSGTKPNGQVDPKAIHTVVARVFQMNQPIGGQPNATIIQATYDNNLTDNLVFFAEASRLWAYFPRTADPGPPFVSWIYFYPGHQTSLILGVNESQKFRLYDYSGVGSFEIRRPPNVSVARATILGADTIKFDGVSVGATSMAIGKVGTQDSMTVLINVFNRTQGSGPSYAPWMPIWEASLSTSERELYRWDTTFSLRKINGTILRDRIVYRVTSRFVQNETVSAAGGSINAEKHVVQISVTEAIDSIAGGTTYSIYNGNSYQMTGNLWIASGIGFVKGEIAGSAIGSGRWFETYLSGYVDAQGFFRGSFFSPRIYYWNWEWTGGGWFEWLFINTQLPPPSGTSSFVLAAKNF